MSQKRWVIVSLCALIAGGVISYVLFPSTEPNQQVTTNIMQEMRQEIQALSERVEAIDVRVSEEVKRIRGSIKKTVDALPPDGVADGLNDELSGFRGVESSPGRMDKP
jgi:dihydroorotase-like cyclic amidohydrolase